MTLESQARRVLDELRAERKEDILFRADQYGGAVDVDEKDLLNPQTLRSHKSRYRMYLQTLSETKDDPEARAMVLARTIALRRVVQKMEQAQDAAKASRLGDQDELVEASPKYGDKKPGSDGIMKAQTIKKERASYFKWLDEEAKRGKAEGDVSSEQIDKWVKSKKDEFELYASYQDKTRKAKAELAKIQKEVDSSPNPRQEAYLRSGEIDRLNRDIKTFGEVPRPPLGYIYERQGYNAKPEMVSRISELRSRQDLLKTDDGSVLIAYRGVSTAEYAQQFKSGDSHFPGSGIYGAGSYSAYARGRKREMEDSAVREARAYSNIDKPESMVAFGVRADARVIDLSGAVARQELVTAASEKSGYRVYDPGEAAAVMGYDAFVMPDMTSNHGYLVLLNRGAAVVAAENP